MQMPVRSVRLEDDIWIKLLAMSDAYDIPVSEIVRIAISSFIKERETKNG